MTGINRFYLPAEAPEIFMAGTLCSREWRALVEGANALAEIDPEEFFQGDHGEAAIWLHEAAQRVGIRVDLVKGRAETPDGPVPHVWLVYYCGHKAVIFDVWNEAFPEIDGFGTREGRVVRPLDIMSLADFPDWFGEEDGPAMWEIEESMREVY